MSILPKRAVITVSLLGHVPSVRARIRAIRAAARAVKAAAARLTLKAAREITGHRSGLGKPSKMPGASTGIPARHCRVGAKLAKIPNSVCSGCYALKGNYTFPSVRAGQEARFAALNHPLWTAGMVKLIGNASDRGEPWFRIHDSGDFQSEDHILRWIIIALAVPGTRFWAPSKESTLVRRILRLTGGWLPRNLVIRLSAPIIGAAPPRAFTGLPTSTVDSGQGLACPAPSQGGECGKCRACWRPSVANVDYHVH
jgi:hypothetical protein